MEIISFDQVARGLNFKSRFSRSLLRIGFRVFRIDDFNRDYDLLKHNKGQNFIDSVLNLLNIRINFNSEILEQIPANEPFLIISNHPHGIVDGLAILKVLSQIRPDIKVVVNDLLDPIEPLEELFLTVDLESDHEAIYKNGKKIFEELRNGTPLIFFPAGSVSHFHMSKGVVMDKPWNETCMKILSKSRLQIVPVYIKGRASIMYHLLYNFFIKISLVWLIREFYDMRNRTISLNFGKPFGSLPEKESELETYLRDKVYSLKK